MPNIIAYVRHFYLHHFIFSNIYRKSKDMKKFWLSVLRSDGRISSKRLITLLAFALIVLGFLGNMIWKYTIDAGIFESVQWIVLGGLGFTASERFSGGKQKTDESSLEEPIEESK